MKTTRPAVLSLAVILLILASFLNVLAPFFPNNDPHPAPAVVVYGSVVLGVLGLVAAFGLFKLKRWSMGLTILVSVLSAFLGAGGTVSATQPLVKGLGALLVVLGILIIVLVILPSARQAYADGAGIQGAIK